MSHTIATLQALSLEQSLHTLLITADHTWHVHSVFVHALNIQNEAGELYTVVARHLGNAPRTLVADVRDFSAYAITAGDSLRSDGVNWQFSDTLKIFFAKAQVWTPSLPSYPVETSRVNAHLPILRTALAEQTNTADYQTAFLRAAYAMLNEVIQQLSVALRAADWPTVQRAVQGLLGLGPGLTPAGDDFLLGFFAVVRMPAYPFAIADNVAQYVLQEGAQRTNVISYSALKMAVEGKVRESISDLLQSVVYGDADAVKIHLARVLAIGSSSGSDILRGILAAFIYAQSDSQSQLH